VTHAHNIPTPMHSLPSNYRPGQTLSLHARATHSRHTHPPTLTHISSQCSSLLFLYNSLGPTYSSLLSPSLLIPQRQRASCLPFAGRIRFSSHELVSCAQHALSLAPFQTQNKSSPSSIKSSRSQEDTNFTAHQQLHKDDPILSSGRYFISSWL
jgi:hypothetical protein